MKLLLWIARRCGPAGTAFVLGLAIALIAFLLTWLSFIRYPLVN